MDWSHLWNNVLNICILYICRENSNFFVWLSSFPLRILVFNITCLPGTLLDTSWCGLASLSFPSSKRQIWNPSGITSSSYWAGSLSMVCILGCPLLSGLCSPYYLTLENEILISFLPLLFLLLGRVWVENQEGNFLFTPASVQHIG